MKGSTLLNQLWSGLTFQQGGSNCTVVLEIQFAFWSLSSHNANFLSGNEMRKKKIRTRDLLFMTPMLYRCATTDANDNRPAYDWRLLLFAMIEKKLRLALAKKCMLRKKPKSYYGKLKIVMTMS